ncbi:TetR/AcrR family transcriptional regulator [Parafrankia sp. EUN1f]|uniref:TetR/AcrR family transcriptional regulator n=1 Tax=Parafrankia sp. EUN1f TaxID=102897 RepID=UPI0001C46FF4|nr:TetR/AcrR family transcriptional regulator [Parafrankia sp. EUN1f]EFC82607.1 transcriptional regulator, TetR family [Parafrankia sp. EUN1f]
MKSEAETTETGAVVRTRTGRPTPAEAAEITARLRRAAVEIFLRDGYDRTTMEAVAQAAGITKRTLYARYADKRTLFLAVISWALARHERDPVELDRVPDGLTEGLTVIARSLLARAVDPDLVALHRMAIAEAARFPEFAAHSRTLVWSPRLQAVMSLLRRHAERGTIVVDDVEIAAEQFIALVSMSPAWLATFGITRDPEAAERHLRHAVALFLNGVRRRDNAHDAGFPASH